MRDLSTSESKSNEEILEAFISVLNCTKTEAIFFLESALWDIERAIHFWLDSDKGAAPSNRRFKMESRNSSINHLVDEGGEHNGMAKYEHRNLGLTDLPTDWSAWIHPHTGSVYFLHSPSGVVQYSVPPGYADAPKYVEEKEPEFLEESERLSTVALSLNSLTHNYAFNQGPSTFDRDGSNESVRADCDSHTHTNDDFDELKFSNNKSCRSSPTDFQSLSNISNTEENYMSRDVDYMEELDDINQK